MEKTLKAAILILLLPLFIIIAGCDENNTQSQKGVPSSTLDVTDNLLARNYYVVFDGSGSMNGASRCSNRERKYIVAQQALIEFAVKVIPANANLGLAVFDENPGSVNELVPLGSDNKQTFINQVNRISVGGGTPLAEAIELAHSKIAIQKQRQLGYGEYFIVVVTDGEADSMGALKEAVNQVLSRDPEVIIFTIGFCLKEKHSLNQPGRTVYKEANSPEELKKGLAEILAESERFKDVTGFRK